MESPSRRSLSRGRSRTPEDVDRYRSGSPDYRANGASDRSRSRTRDRSMSRSRSRSRSPPPAPKSCKIVVEKLTKNVHEGHLREIFGVYGDIEELEMPVNRQFMTNKGIAYILYTKAAYAEDAISRMHEAQLDGAMISVSIVLPRRRFDRSPPPMRPKSGAFGEPHRLTAGGRGPPPPDRGYGRPLPSRGSPVYGGRGPRRDSPDRGYGGRGGRGGYRDRPPMDRYGYRPRSYSRDRSPPPRRSRSPPRRLPARSPTHSISRTPPRRDRSPPRSGAGRRRRSPSYSSYGSRSPSRSRSRSRRH